MGLGSSKPIAPEVLVNDDMPVQFRQLHTDGKMEHRDEFHGGQKRTRLSEADTVKHDNKDLIHRIIENSRDLLAEDGQLKKPKCPECARGKHTGAKCRLCGADVTPNKASTAGSLADSVVVGDPKSALQSRQTVVQMMLETEALRRLRYNHVDGGHDAYPCAQKRRSEIAQDKKDAVKDLVDRNGNLIPHPIAVLRLQPGQNNSNNNNNHRDSKVIQHALRGGVIGGESVLEEKMTKRHKNDVEGLKTLETMAIADLDDSDINPLGNILSPVVLQLVAKTSTSLGIEWDVDPKALISLQTIRSSGMHATTMASSSVDRQQEGDSSDEDCDETGVCLYDISFRPVGKTREQLDILNAQRQQPQSLSGREEKTDTASKENPWMLAAHNIKKNRMTMSDLLPNTFYEIRCKRVGWGCWGPTLTLRTNPGAPHPPTKLTALEVMDESVSLSWTPSGGDNGMPILEYVVTCRPWGKDGKEVYRGKNRTCVIRNLASNSVHAIEVRAVNQIGPSVDYARLAIRTLVEGSASMTPWEEFVDEDTEEVHYRHQRTKVTAQSLPVGAIVHEEASFRNKYEHLKKRFLKRSKEAKDDLKSPNFQFHVKCSRSNLLEESLQCLYSAKRMEIDASVLRVNYKNEEGIDAGGLSKDWFTAMAHMLAIGTAGLLFTLETGYVMVDPRAAVVDFENTKWLYEAVGIFLAKSMVDAQTLGILVSPSLLLHLTGRYRDIGASSLQSEQDVKEAAATKKSSQQSSEESEQLELNMGILQYTDPDIFVGLQWVLENDPADCDLTFSVTRELFGAAITIELFPGGDKIGVSGENKLSYVKLMVDWHLRRKFEPGLSAVLSGFHRHVTKTDLTHFSLQNIQSLLGGKPTIDVNEVKQGFQLTGGFQDSSSQVKWLWQVLESFDQQRLSQFLGFVSGCSSFPLGGLRPPLTLTLMQQDGSEGGTRAGITTDTATSTTTASSACNNRGKPRQKDASHYPLPKAHTCFNQLVLPEYPSLDVLKEKLTFALDNTEEGFFMS